MTLQENNFEATAERRCVTLAKLWERQPGGPTWIWLWALQLGSEQLWPKGGDCENVS
jgi:hypothetical protein